MENVYIYNVQPLIIDDELVWDLFYLKESSTKINCIRIYDIELSFLMARLPGLTDSQFKEYMKFKLPDAKIEYRHDLKESEYFNFENNRLYAEIFSQDPRELKEYVKTLHNELKFYYKRITDPTKLTPSDYIFYKNSETPFRYTATTTSVANSIYNLSCKHNVPLIGGAVINRSKLETGFPQECSPRIDGEIKGLAFKNIKECITRNDDINFQKNMRLLAYDIETYTPDGPRSDPSKREHEIFCIGVGIFTLDRQDPIENICLISKDIKEEIPHENKVVRFLNRKAYLVDNEYGSGQDNDSAYYVICKNEKDLLEAYCEILSNYTPQIITGFNTYGFDDRFVYKRCEIYGLTSAYLQCFSYYSLAEMSDCVWYKPFGPEFKEFVLKIDGRMRRDNATVHSWNVMATDVYKIMLKEDAKRFTQQGYGNLNTMLNVYKVNNPYNGEPLSKTDMSIDEMFKNWKAGKNIYEIALYCRQDAWITGTLIIKRSKFGDMIELANVSFTSFRDSIFKADGMRVNNTIIAEAYSQGFALKDEKSEERTDIIDQKEDLIELGGKKFDSRTIVGGAVKNLHPGINKFVVALDFSSMYPSQKEANMADSSSRVDDEILKDPERYGLKIVKRMGINDMYGDREVIYIKKIS